MSSIHSNIDVIKENIKDICNKSNRKLEEIYIIAVTKTIDIENINTAIEYGIDNIGENKVQEIMDKYENISKKIKWHLIGHLQTNKVKYIIEKVDLIHSLDSINLAEEIDKRAKKHGLIKEVLVQVNVAKEETKFGIDLNEVEVFIEQVSKFNNIRIKGLMTIAPLYEDVECVRPVFRALKQRFDELSRKQIPNVEMKYLSMGMTNDYLIAIEEGANIVRIGTGIFGRRNYSV